MYSTLCGTIVHDAWDMEEIHYISFYPFAKLCTQQSENLVGKK